LRVRAIDRGIADRAARFGVESDDQQRGSQERKTIAKTMLSNHFTLRPEDNERVPNSSYKDEEKLPTAPL
jgi:hypothetical protein